MKNLSFLLLALSPLFLRAQLNEWLPGKALTDSSHNNRNACFYGQFVDNLMVWEQELNSTTTQLCYKSLDSASGDMHVALSLPGIKLTNPKILDLSDGFPLTDFEVFYQTNEASDIDLNYITFKSDGTITVPVTLANLPGDDVNLTIGHSGVVAWENNGKIWVSQYLLDSNLFTDPFAIDSAGAYSPIFATNNYLNYLKPNGDSTTIISIHVFYFEGNWILNNLTTKAFIGECSSISASGSFGNEYLAMQHKAGTNPSGLIIFTSWMSDFDYLNSPTFNYSQPAIADFIIAIKTSMNYFLSYVSDSLTQNEIFAEVPFGYYQGSQNISQWPGDDRNPQFYATYCSSFIRVYLFWESERQGYSTIYSSHFDFLTGEIEELPKPENITVAPSPFNKETTIAFQSAEVVKVMIFDFQGREIKSILPQILGQGRQTALWDGTNNSGNRVPSGSYVVVISSGNATFSRIIIKK